MALLSLEPEFIVDRAGAVQQGVVVLDGAKFVGVMPSAPLGSTRVRLANKMLMPGFANVHSHALQRALRGRVEDKSPKGRDDFWSWRTLMYADAHLATPDDVEAVASLAYLEMLKAGFTSVGEFNYLHHQPFGVHFTDETTLSDRLVRASAGVGIRQVLLTCAYERKNWRESLTKEQKRFAFESAQEFLNYAKSIRNRLRSPLLTHGVAIHSTRACSPLMIEEICKDSFIKRAPLHIHASEQTGEVQEAFDEYGKSPVAALHALGALFSNTTLIHATHLTPDDVQIIADAKTRVGLCPSTERNLGDGLCPIEDLWLSGVELCIGTDQHVRLDPVNELRDIEEQERLRLKKRCVIAKPGRSVAESLVPIGSTNGQRSLGLDADQDFVAIELSHFYEVLGPVHALNEWLVSGSHRDVSDVFINGNHVVKNRIALTETPELMKAAQEALQRLVKADVIPANAGI